MKRHLRILPVVLLFTIAIAILEAGGPKTPIVAQTIGGGAATVNVLLCGASPFPCTGVTFACPVISIAAGDLLVKTSCGPVGFKVKQYQYTITGSSFGCGGVALSGETVTCNNGAIPDVSFKVGH